MADDQYAKYSRMLELLENGAGFAEELAAKGKNPIKMEDWNDQIEMINGAIAYGNPDLTARANALVERLKRLKPEA